MGGKGGNPPRLLLLLTAKGLRKSSPVTDDDSLAYRWISWLWVDVYIVQEGGVMTAEETMCRRFLACTPSPALQGGFSVGKLEGP